MDEFLPLLFRKTGLRREQFRVILTQDNCCPTQREGYDGNVGNPYVHLKPLNKVWEILIDGYDDRNTVIVDDSKEKHVFNDEGNCIITKSYTCHDVNDTFLLDRLWPCLLHLNGVGDVRPIVKSIIELI